MMTSQPDLFARLSDPATSHEAAKADRSTLELDVLSAIRAAGSFGCTTDEVWHALGCKGRPNSIARRITSLAKAGRVELCGTRPGDSGRAQQCWRTPSYMAGGAA